MASLTMTDGSVINVFERWRDGGVARQGRSEQINVPSKDFTYEIVENQHVAVNDDIMAGCRKWINACLKKQKHIWFNVKLCEFATVYTAGPEWQSSRLKVGGCFEFNTTESWRPWKYSQSNEWVYLIVLYLVVYHTRMNGSRLPSMRGVEGSFWVKNC